MLRGEVDKLSRFGQDWIKFLLLFKLSFLSFEFDVRLEQNYFRLNFLTLKERKACNVVMFCCRFHVSSDPDGLCFSWMSVVKLVHHAVLFNSLH
jgi:hypothetical protein